MHNVLDDTRSYNEVNINKKPRKQAIYLDEREKWQIAVYCIENKCVTVDTEGKFTKYRMFLKHICEEVESLIGKKITEHHIKDSMEFYHAINDIVKLVPDVPLQESVQEEMLKIELQKVMHERDEFAKEIESLNYLYAKTVLLLEDTSTKMEQMYRGMGGNNAKNKKT